MMWLSMLANEAGAELLPARIDHDELAVLDTHAHVNAGRVLEQPLDGFNAVVFRQWRLRAWPAVSVVLEHLFTSGHRLAANYALAHLIPLEISYAARVMAKRVAAIASSPYSSMHSVGFAFLSVSVCRRCLVCTECRPSSA